MIDFFEKWYNLIIDRNKILSTLKFYSFMRYVIRLTSNIVIPIYFKLNEKNNNLLLPPNDIKENRIIVSLTSFPLRINKVWLVIESILRQTIKPHKIILYLSKTQFPTENILPKSLLNLKKRGLVIVLVENDYRSHKKYLYTLRQYPNDYMLTIDDDIFYQSDMIENLYNASLKFPSTILAQYCKKMVWEDNELIAYEKWITLTEETKPSFDIFFGSGGGVLFPPRSLFPDVVKEDLFMKLCPTADDVWLNAMCRLNNIKVKKIKSRANFLPVQIKSDETLNSINNGMKQNDIQIQSISSYYLKIHNIKVYRQEKKLQNG